MFAAKEELNSFMHHMLFVFNTREIARETQHVESELEFDYELISVNLSV
jgi:hypothetical protein